MSSTTARSYGTEIVSNGQIVKYNKDAATPEAKCNTVSFTKAEDVPNECRHTVAICDRYMSYIVKGKLLRVIHTLDGSKLLLRNHGAHVLDAKFCVGQATSDNIRQLVSVDAGENATDCHTFMWTLAEADASTGAELRIEAVSSFRNRGSVVAAHPSQSGCWLVAHDNELVVLDAAKCSCNSGSTLEGGIALTISGKPELSLKIRELTFSGGDGNSFVALSNVRTATGEDVGDYYHVFCFAESNVEEVASGFLSEFPRQGTPALPGDVISSLMIYRRGGSEGGQGETSFLRFRPVSLEECGITSDSRVARVEVAQLRVRDGGNQGASTEQVVCIDFPLVDDPSAIATNSADDKENSRKLVCACVDHWMTYGKVVVVTHKHSKFIAYLSLDSISAPLTAAGCIRHVTFVDLRYSPQFPVSMVMSGEEFHSSHSGSEAAADAEAASLLDTSGGVVDHIELACVQLLNDKTKQSAVQQYHVSVKDIFMAYDNQLAWPAPCGASVAAAAASSAQLPSSGTMLLKNLLGGRKDTATPPVTPVAPVEAAPAAVPSAAASSASAGETPGGATSTLKNFLSGLGVGKAVTKQDKESPAATSVSPPPAPAKVPVPVAPVEAVSPKTKSVPVAAENPQAASPVPAAKPDAAVAAPALEKKSIDVAESKPAAVAVKKEKPAVASPTRAAAPTAAAPNAASSLLLQSMKQNRSSTTTSQGTASAAPAAVTPPHAPVAVSNAAGTITVSRAELQEMVDAAMARSRASDQVLKEQIVSDVVVQVNGAIAVAMEAQRSVMEDMVKKQSSGGGGGKEAVTAFKKVIETSMLPGFQKSADNMFAQINAAFTAGIEGILERNNTYYQQQLEKYADVSKPVISDALKQHVVPEMTTALNKQMTQMQGQVSSHLADHRKESMETQAQNNDVQFAQMKELQNLMLGLQNKMESVALMSSGRGSGGSGSSAAGADQMRILMAMQRDLKTVLQHVAANGVGDRAGGAGVKYEENPIVLMQQGRLAEAIELALELKDITLLNHVLSLTDSDEISEAYEGSVATGGEKLSTVVLLCLIQQLAADLANNSSYVSASGSVPPTPPPDAAGAAEAANASDLVRSRVDWLKSLIMLVTEREDEAEEDGEGDNNQHKTVLQRILSDLQGFYKKLGARTGKSSTATSVKFDVQMLVCLLQQRM